MPNVLNLAVIGAGPLGACSAHALAIKLDELALRGKIHLIDANNPLDLDFSGLSASGPNAAGQLIMHAFEAGSYAKTLARRTHEALIGIAKCGFITLYPRRWVICAGIDNSSLDTITRDVLFQAHQEGHLEGCKLLDAKNLGDIPGLRMDQVSFAVIDESAMAVHPPHFVRGLVRMACSHNNVLPHFGSKVLNIGANGILRIGGKTETELAVDAVILCTGIHAETGKELLPRLRPEYLHVLDHQNDEHIPKLLDLIVGESTIARYPGFGQGRRAITPHLSKGIRELGIHGLMTDVPGLRRMLDSHFADKVLAESNSAEVYALLRDLIGRYVHRDCLLGAPESSKSVTHAYVAAYAKLLDGDGPFIEVLDFDLPVVYAQPSNGLGLNQCAGIGEDAADLLLSCLV